MIPAQSMVLFVSVVLYMYSSQSVSAMPMKQFHSQHVLYLDPYPDKPRLTFRGDGTFKLTVFSDLHFGEAEYPFEPWGPEQDVNSTRLMKKVLRDENPDYVVLNGDLITGETTFLFNSTLYIDQIVAPLNAARVPFSSTHGNHDNEPNITHIAEIQRENLIAPLSYTRAAPPGVGGKEGPGTYWVPIYKYPKDRAPVLILWFFDSRGGYSTGPDSAPVPDYVDPTVAAWIERETTAMNAAWGPGDTRGALAFVHIPPSAIRAVQATLNSTQNPGLNADELGSGSTQASIDPFDSGADKAFWDALNLHVENLHAVISGHDHGNEWCAREPTKNVVFCFDKHSGYGGYTGDGWGHGVRNILFQSPDPQVGLITWIRLEDGETRANVTLDKNFK